DQVADTMTLVSHAADSPTTTSDGDSGSLSLSPDGRYTLFDSSSTNLVPGQTETTAFHPLGVFVFDRVTGRTTLVSHAAAAPTTGPKEDSENAVMSADGRFVVYESRATNLLPGQPSLSGGDTVYLSNLQAGTTMMVSHAVGSPTTPARGESDHPQI